MAHPQYTDHNRLAAENKYALFRELAYTDVIARISLPTATRLEGIGFDALKMFDDVWRKHSRQVDWDWIAETHYWKKKQHARLELAIWHQNALCGLMLGSTSRRKKILYVRGVEGAPWQHGLKGKIIPLCIEVAEAYATLLCTREIWLVSPAEALVPWYAKLGYNLHRGLHGSYAVKKMECQNELAG